MPLANQQLVVSDFSGGITDYVLDAKPEQSAEIENFLINPNRKLETAPGSDIYDADFPQVPDGNVRIGGLMKSIDPNLYVMSGRKVWYPGTSSWTELLGPSSNPVFSTGTSSSTQYAYSEWNDHLFVTNSDHASPVKIYKEGSNYRVRTAGLPSLATSPTVTSSGGTGNNYIYAFHYHYTYTVGTTLFQDFGPVTFKTLTNAGAPNVNVVNVTVIPAISNGSTLNYDTASANLKVYIYRTINNGTVFYKVGEVANGTATFNDNNADSAIQTNLILYTDGGVLDYDPPPLSKYVHIVNGVAYYAHIKEGSEIFKNRVYQSIQDDPDSVPQDLYVDVLEEIVGLSSYNDNPLVFTKKRVYRLNGQYNELGQGQVTYEDITKTIGCQSHNSIVQTRFGVFWAGDDGFYWTDGFNFKKISDSINERYKDLVSTTTRGSRIYGAFDTTENRVYWAVTSGDSATDNDAFFILDLRWGVREDSTFTTRVNGDSFAPTAIIFYDGDLIRADRRGFVLYHSSNFTTDPKISTTTAYANWSKVSIIPRYTSTIFNFGLPMVRKWVPKMLLSMQNVTNVSVQIRSTNDNSSAERDLYEIRYRGNVLWGDPEPVWGADLPYWSYFNLIEELRRFPARSLRCSFKQIEITQAFTNIYRSDDYGVGNTDVTAKTLTFAGVWPSDVVDYFVSFETDGYVKEYQITARNSDTVLTYLDAASEQPTATGVKWVIRGYPKGEIFNILSYVLYYAPLTNQSFKTYRSESDTSGGNA